MPALAASIVEAADDLYGGPVADQVEAAFASRGIL
jgi:Zn-dependent metalloprotease